jgi:hypothetical protein
LVVKIYFAGSIAGGREDAAVYGALIDYLKGFGEVATEHIGDRALDDCGEKALESRDIHDRDLQWLLSSDVLIAEVSMPSLGVGYEIAQAVLQGKDVLCLYHPGRGKRLSAMIAGSPGVQVYEYVTLEDAKKGVENFLQKKTTRST